MAIEQANSTNRGFDVKAEIRRSKAFWNSPAGKRRAAKLEIERRNRKENPTKFPDLARRIANRPATATAATAEVKDWAARFGK